MLLPNAPSAARTEDVSGATPYLIVSIQNLSPSGIGGADVVVKVGLEFGDKRELSNSVLDYDVWLVHREADGREVVDRTAGRGLQGKRIDYLFRRLQYKPDGTPGADREIDIDLSGSVKGRVRPDGRIDVSISAERMIIQGALGSGEEGYKKATVADGDTLELELPPHLAHGPKFSSQRTSIRVTVRRVS
jgi:hypothetical protein